MKVNCSLFLDYATLAKEQNNFWDECMIGQKIGPYEIIEEIGVGGMATVYRARQESMGRFVAIKIIHKAISIDHTSIERFQREAQVIARLEHPHILQIGRAHV